MSVIEIFPRLAVVNFRVANSRTRIGCGYGVDQPWSLTPGVRPMTSAECGDR